jgi:hypothetical protein
MDRGATLLISIVVEITSFFNARKRLHVLNSAQKLKSPFHIAQYLFTAATGSL